GQQPQGVSSRLLKVQFPAISTFWSVRKSGGALWSPSYFVGSVGGAPIEILRQYIESQGRSAPRRERRGPSRYSVALWQPGGTRGEVYAFAEAAIAAGRPEAAGAAVICFEFLQRPENVLAGYGRWSDYHSQAAPDAIRIEDHKTG